MNKAKFEAAGTAKTQNKRAQIQNENAVFKKLWCGSKRNTEAIF